MSKEQRNNSGVLFTNRKKETEKHPHYTGNATINGVEYWVSSWVNTSDKGTKYMSLAFTQKDAKPETPKGDIKAKDIPADFNPDDDLPF